MATVKVKVKISNWADSQFTHLQDCEFTLLYSPGAPIGRAPVKASDRPGAGQSRPTCV